MKGKAEQSPRRIDTLHHSMTRYPRTPSRTAEQSPRRAEHSPRRNHSLPRSPSRHPRTSSEMMHPSRTSLPSIRSVALVERWATKLRSAVKSSRSTPVQPVPLKYMASPEANHSGGKSVACTAAIQLQFPSSEGCIPSSCSTSRSMPPESVLSGLSRASDLDSKVDLARELTFSSTRSFQLQVT